MRRGSTLSRSTTPQARTLDFANVRCQGIYYFFSHRFLWPLLRARLIPSVLLSLFVLTNLFLWTYLPQV